MDKTTRQADLFTDAVQQIQLAIRSAAAYPEDHPISSNIIKKSFEFLSDILKNQKALTVSGVDNRLLVDDVAIDGKNILSTNLAMDLDERGINSITFYSGITLKDFTVFLNAMIKRPQVLEQEGGVEKILKEHAITTIKPNGILYGRVTRDDKELDNTHIVDYLSGDLQSLAEHGEEFVDIVVNDPHRIADLIMKATELGDSAPDLYKQTARAKLASEMIQRMAKELIVRQDKNREEFTQSITPALSEFDEALLHPLAEFMEIPYGQTSEVIHEMITKTFYTTLADASFEQYLQNGRFDLDFMETLLPSAEEQTEMMPYLEKKLRESGRSDVDLVLRQFFTSETQEPTEEQLTNHISPQRPNEKKAVKEDLARLILDGKTEEVRHIIADASKKLEHTSWQIRKGAAESFLEITDALNEYKKLREHSRIITEPLIKNLKTENHTDVYLPVSDNLRQIYTSQKRPENFYRNETIGSRLFEAKKISKTQLQQTLTARKNNGMSLHYNLGALNHVDEAVLVHFLAQQYKGCRTAHLSSIPSIPEKILNAIPQKFIRRYLILPFDLYSGNLCAATMKPNDLDMLNDLGFITGYSIVPHLASEYHLLNALEKFYNIETMTAEINRVVEDIYKKDDLEFVEEMEKESPPKDELKDSDAPVVRMVNLILREAITQKASDIHIEPFEKELRLRFRIDGTLSTFLTTPIRYANVVSSRMKVMSGLDISERRLPQDGRFRIKMGSRYVDFRMSTFPGMFGEKVVLRLLDSSSNLLDLEKLGLIDSDMDNFLAETAKSKGMILVTGPTGSGKTTTLYSIISNLNDGTCNISTAEDPIEYNLKGINQFQMNPKIGLDFARALRTLLRQDPDVIMVGEIRDYETAEIAIKAALTGHLVLSTLHTNNAPETITRLLDMHIEPYLITSAVNLIIAQRLMRKICDVCKTETTPTNLQHKILKRYDLDVSDHTLYKGEGCEACNNTGYKGRSAIYEIMPLNEELQEIILKDGSFLTIKEKAQKLGLVPLQNRGFQRVLEGVTSLDEWVRVLA